MPTLKHRTTMPRPGDPDIIKRFADATRKGHPVATAATLAGISVRTADNWLALGVEEADIALEQGTHDAQGHDAEQGPHVPFMLAVRAAEADAVDAHLAVFEEVSNKPGHWQRSAWYLERKHAGTFGMRQHITSESRSVSVNVTLEALPEAQREALIAALARGSQRQLTEGNET